MREDDLKRRIVDRMSVIDAHVKGRTKHGLNDASTAIETLYREVLNMTRGWNLTSANFGQHDFPAVDLHDEGQRIAVQVTATCDTTKIVKTQKAFQDHKLDQAYDKLIFIGIESLKTSSKLELWAEIWSQSKLLNLENLDLQQLEHLDSRLAQSISWHAFVEMSDRHCFDVVMGILDRDAIRHETSQEGDFGAMTTGLMDIKRIVNSGEIPGTRHLAKPLPLYSQKYQDILLEIDESVGRMRSLVQRNTKTTDYLPWKVATKVDLMRHELVNLVNAFCDANNHGRRIRVWSGD
ncbi:hypothetical protein D9V34_14320 [Mycetocola lacteus]|uniref:SMEK domain-containing protein n=1 Tax=Mycetocola lacteus TaxID=76637 RepID=A0A3L7AIB0_9MICO|nr:SMEK domain-containing protein [Mycetocola lacteus]RLP80236.1 hypothetical protein D9V34_14320 [Mycetocola lacteus]